MRPVVTSRAIAGIVALASAACGSYDESNGLVALGGVGPGADVWINELMPRNSSSVPDEMGDFDDWIEIYNAGEGDVSLDGYFVSDSGDSLYKSQLSAEAVVPGEGFLLLWADNEPDGGLHLGFRLSGDGEEVWLTSPDGNVVDSVTFGAGPAESSYSKYPGGADDGAGEWRWCSPPTPGESNGEDCE